jgi:hypothetical protein
MIPTKIIISNRLAFMEIKVIEAKARFINKNQIN